MPRAGERIGASGIGALAGIVLALACGSAAHAGKAHRWVDADGNVHYGDAPPPEAARAAATAADEGDATGAVTATAPTAEARAGAEREARADAERRRHDRMLLRSYTTVEDLERTRDRRLGGIDARIGLATHKLHRAERRAAGFEQALNEMANDADGRAELESALATARERAERARAALAALEDRRAGMAARFAEDIERFVELMEARE